MMMIGNGYISVHKHNSEEKILTLADICKSISEFFHKFPRECRQIFMRAQANYIKELKLN